MTVVSQALRRIDSPSAFSAATWIIAFAPSVTTAVVHDRNLYGGAVLSWLTAALAGALAAGAVLLIAHRLLSGRRPVPVVLAVFMLAGCARGVSVGGTAFALGLVDDPQFASRALSGAILATFWLSVGTIIVDGFRRHRTTRMELDHLQAAAEQNNRAAAHELATLRIRTHAEVTTRIGQLAQRWSALAESGRSIDPVELRSGAEELHVLAAEVVRPLSHDAASASVRPAPTRARRSRLRAYLVIASDAVRVDPFRPGWVSLLLFPSILTTAVRWYGWILGIVGAAWIVAMAALVLWAARRVLTPRLRRWPFVTCAVISLVVWVAAGVASAVPVAWSAQWGVGPERAWEVFGVPLLYYLPITCLGVAIASAIAQSWALDADAQRARIAAIEWQTQRLQQGIWAERTRLGRFLHGSVQSSLTSTALLIESGLSRQVAESQLVAQAADRLEQLLAAVEGHDGDGVAMVDVEEVLGSIATVWMRLATITIDLDAQARALCGSDPDAAEHVVEIVREAIANAIRHGRATRVGVDITSENDVKAPMCVRIGVRDDGTWQGQFAPGMGSAMLDDLCIAWSRERVDGWTVLEALVPTARAGESPLRTVG